MREYTVRVSRFRLIRVLNNHYSVPSRLIGTKVKVRVRSESLELHHGAAHVLTLPRIAGRNQRRIDYRHLIWSLVRKPGAFANYCYREELFPTTFRRAYDALLEAAPSRADRDYLRLLHLAASGSEADVEESIATLLAADLAPTFDAVREQLGQYEAEPAPAFEKITIKLASYDSLIPSRSVHGKQSGLFPGKTLRTLDLHHFDGATRMQMEGLQGGDFLKDAVNVIAVGRPGAGKSHFACALGHALVELGHPVLLTPPAALVQRLLRPSAICVCRKSWPGSISSTASSSMTSAMSSTTGTRWRCCSRC
jgi:hypothetical protein